MDHVGIALNKLARVSTITAMFKILKSKNTERIRWWWRLIDIFALNFNPTSVWLAEYHVPRIRYVFTHK